MFFEQETLHFYFSLGPTNYVAGSIFLNINKHVLSVYYVSTMVPVTWGEVWEGKEVCKPFILFSQFGNYVVIYLFTR